MFLDTAGGSVLASIFKLTKIFVPRAAILVIISASSTAMQAVGIFFTPVHDKQTNKQKKLKKTKQTAPSRAILKYYTKVWGTHKLLSSEI